VFGSTQVPLHVLSAQTGAVCTGDYAWADNSKGDSPCLLAAKVLGACHNPNWDIPALDGSHFYTNPNSSTADFCSCSWTAYNLLSACEACQGFQNDIQGWSPYILVCTSNGFLSTTYFPTGKFALPDGTAIPAWAAVNPTQWPDQTFSPTQAHQIADQAKPDLIPNAGASGTQKSSTPTGAIAGGVVGGVAALLLAAGIVFFMARRKRGQQRSQALTNGYISGPSDPGHGRTISDLSQKSTATGIGVGYSRLNNFSQPQAPLLPTATMHTHASSVHSLSYFGSAVGSATYPAPSISHPINPAPMSPSPPPVNREDVIVPYTVPQSSNPYATSPASERKRSDGGVVVMYDQPTSPPVNIDAPVTSRRPRVNPPEYTPYPEPGPDDSSSQIRAPSLPSRPPHVKTGSADTQRSWDSGTTARSGQPGRGPRLDGVVEMVDSPESEIGSSVFPSTRTVATLRGGSQDHNVAM